jgi:hypothetical protein
MQVIIDRDGDRYRWRLVRRTEFGGDVLARGMRAYETEVDCHHAVSLLADASAETMLVVQRPDGHWGWQAYDPDGEPLAESPAVFRDACACGRALAELRREVSALPVV